MGHDHLPLALRYVDLNPVRAELTPASAAQNVSGQGIVVFANTQNLAAPSGFACDNRPASARDVLTVLANGLGPVEPEIGDGVNSCDPDGVCLPDFPNLVLRRTRVQPRIFVGGVEVPGEDLLFSSLSPQYVSLYEVHFKLPEGAPSGSAVPIVLRVDEIESQGDVTIEVE